MRTMKKLLDRTPLWLLLLLLGSPLGLQAQIGVELIENGDFETFRQQGLYDKPIHWSINTTLSPEKSTEAHSGNYALRLYLNAGRSSVIYFKNTEQAPVAVQAGAKYELSYWYKGVVTKKNIIPEITWYKAGQIVRPESREEEKVTITDEWQQHKVTFVAPVADHCSIALTFEGDTEGGVKMLTIDDVSFKMTQSGGGAIPLAPPSGFQAVPQQREIALSWFPLGIEGVTYKIAMNGVPLITTEATAYIVTGLSLDTEYVFTIQSEKGSESSSLSPILKTRTHGLSVGETDEARIPYLYRIKDHGYTDRNLLLHWNDLADRNAKILYWIDGVSVSPSGDVLTFPKTGVQRLRVEIVEKGERRWNIEYRLHVK